MQINFEFTGAKLSYNIFINDEVYEVKRSQRTFTITIDEIITPIAFSAGKDVFYEINNIPNDCKYIRVNRELLPDSYQILNEANQIIKQGGWNRGSNTGKNSIFHSKNRKLMSPTERYRKQIEENPSIIDDTENTIEWNQASVMSIVKRIKNEYNFPKSSMVKKEFNYLLNILKGDETFEIYAEGIYDGNTWLIVLTNKRVIFLDKGMVYGLKVYEIPLNKINSISYSKGMVYGSLSVFHGSSNALIKNIRNEMVQPFAKKVDEQLDKLKEDNNKKINSSQVINNSNKESVTDKLKKLKELLDMEIITQEEFQSKKSELLSKM